MKPCRKHLELAWWQHEGMSNTPRVVGRRCLLAAFNSKKWESWDDFEKRTPTTEIANATGCEINRMSDLLNGKELVTDDVFKNLAAVCGVNWEWLLRGIWKVRPEWFEPYEEAVIIHQTAVFQEKLKNNPYVDRIAVTADPIPEPIARMINRIQKEEPLDGLSGELVAVSLTQAEWGKVEFHLEYPNPEGKLAGFVLEELQQLSVKIRKQITDSRLREPDEVLRRKGRK